MALALSCSKEQPVDSPADGSVDLEQFCVEASMEAASKTYFDGGSKLLWSNADNIRLISAANGKSSEFLYKSGAGTSSATFEGVSSGAGAYYAFYPSCNFKSFSEGVINFSLPKSLSYDNANNISTNSVPSFAYFADKNSGAVFYNAVGLVRVQIKGDYVISKLKLVSSNASDVLWGNGSITVGDVSNPSGWSVGISGGDNVLELNCAGGGHQLSASNSIFYFPIPVGCLSKGFKVIVYNASGDPVDEFATANDFTSVRNMTNTLKSVTAGTFTVLDADESSNCYIVNRNSDSAVFKFCTTKGNSSELVGASSVATLWETVNSDTAPAVGSVVKNVELHTNCVTFKVNKQYGNALVAVKNSSGDIAWSWHIWLPEEYPVTSTVYTSGRNRPTVLALNLGDVKIGSSSLGFLYQWGRKDPFAGICQPGSTTLMATTGTITHVVKSDENGNIDYTIKNPTVIVSANSDWNTDSSINLWSVDGSAAKTVYDPCPVGYRVPNSTDFSNISASAEEWDGTNYWFIFHSQYWKATGHIYYSSSGVYSDKNDTKYGYYWTRNVHVSDNTKGCVFYFGQNDGGSIRAFPGSTYPAKAMACAVRCIAE